MNTVTKNIIIKISAILVIIALVISDIMFVGITAVSYAVDTVQTNNHSIEFSAYFLNANGEKVEKLEENIDKEETCLYVDIMIKNEGYLQDGTITINNSNFDIKEEKISKKIEKISGNEVKLKQINAGNVVTIKLGIQAKQEERITENILNAKTEISFKGQYINSKNVEKNKHIEIKGKTQVEINWKSSEMTNAELDTKLLTNSIYEINGEQKRIVQILVNNNITNNNYPIKNTTITANSLENVEDVSVQARSTSATNSNINFSTDNYNYNSQNKEITIELSNEDKKNISWNKNVQDTFIIMYVLNKDEDITNKQIEINSQINTYDNKNISSQQTINIDKEIDGIISSSIKLPEDAIYKGKIYTGEARDYVVTNQININDIDDEENINIKIEESKYLINEEEQNANIIYKETKISRNEFLKLFGEEGNITIKDQNGNDIVNINKDTEVDEKGKIIINYQEGIKEINIQTSKPADIGTLNIENTKTILNSEYGREIVKQFTAIREGITINDNQNTKNITLKETETEAALAMDLNTISTIADKTSLTLAVVLKSNDEGKDLYKNPNIKITFPKEITILSAQYKALYKNGLEIANCSSNKNTNEEYEININLNGEQKNYDATGKTTIYLKLEIKTDKLTPSKTSSINMEYTNQYNNITNSVTKEFKFESQYGLMIHNQMKNYNNSEDTIITIDKETEQGSINANSPSREVTLETALINNYGQAVSNVVLLGTIPSEDNNDTYKVELNNIELNNPDAKISYSEIPNVGLDDESWGDNINTAVSYKIEIPKMEKEEVIQIRTKMILPENIKYNKNGEFTTRVQCDYQDKITTNKSNIKLSTDANILAKTKNASLTQKTEKGLTTEITTLLGNNDLSNEDEIYEGETLKYKIKITNNTGKDYEKVQVKANQKNGYVWDIIDKEGYNPFYETSNVQKFYNMTESDEIELGTIKNLKNGESYEFEYQATTYLLNNKNIDGNSTYGTISISSNDNELKETVTTIKNNLTNAELQLNLDDGDSTQIKTVPGEGIRLALKMKNLTSKDLNNIQAKLVFSKDLIADVSLIEQSKSKGVSLQNTEKNSDGTTVATFKISSIKSGETIEIYTTPSTELNIKQDQIDTWVLAQATTSNNNTYISNMSTRTIYNQNYDITVNQQVLDENGTEINTNKEKLNDGEKVKFMTTITNNEEEEVVLDIIYNIDNKITVESAEVTNGNQKLNISEDLTLVKSINEEKQTIKPGESIVINVVGSVYTLGIDSITNVLYTYNDINCKSSSSELKVLVNTLQETSDDIINNNNNNNKIEEKDQDFANEYIKQVNDNNQEDNNNNNNEEETDSENEEDDEDEAQDDNTNYDDILKYKISGTVWSDQDKNGKRDTSELVIGDVEVNAINIETGEKVASAKTNSDGRYSLDLQEGKYIIAFIYNNEIYTVTTYQADGISDEENSDAIENEINIDGENRITGTTDIINLNTDIANINIGLIQRKTFDLSIQKCVSKISIQTDKETNTYEQEDGTTLAKAEIKAKYLDNALVVIEYKMKITNTGDIVGYATNIMDYMPSTLKFNSELNPEWYISGEYIYNTSLANTRIEPGETQEVILILTKSMTESNTGLINNKAEISESSNSLGIEDETNDTGSADVIISVSTGALVSYVITTLTSLIVLVVLAYVINQRYGNKRI